MFVIKVSILEKRLLASDYRVLKIIYSNSARSFIRDEIGKAGNELFFSRKGAIKFIFDRSKDR